MRISNRVAIWMLTFAAAAAIPQSAAPSAIRNPQSATSPSAVPSAVRNREAAIRNPHSAMPASTSWRALFDGKSLGAWRGYKSDKVPEGWKIVDKTLAKDGHVGDLITREEFGDFELELEWKIGHAGNSGIFYRGIEDPDFKGAPNDDRIYTTGPE